MRVTESIVYLSTITTNWFLFHLVCFTPESESWLNSFTGGFKGLFINYVCLNMIDIMN